MVLLSCDTKPDHAAHVRVVSDDTHPRKKKTPRTHGNPIAQRECNALRFTPDPDVTDNRARFRAFNAEIGQRVFAYITPYW